MGPTSSQGVHVTSQDLVGQRIKTIRRQRGLSQAQLAHPELSDSYVSLIESGKRTPTPAVLELLAQKLDCSLTYLVNGVTAEQMEELDLGLRFARMALENGEFLEARRRYRELMDDKSLVGLASLRQDVQFGYARSLEACAELDEAIEMLDSLLESDTEAQTPSRRVAIAVALCRCYRERGDFQEGVDVGERILGETARQHWNDDLVELGATLLSVYFWRGDLLRARQFATELLSAAETLASPRSTVAACWNAAVTAEHLGFGEEAMSLIERALAVQSETGGPRNLARLRGAYAKLLLQVRPGEAELARDITLRAMSELKESSAGLGDIIHCSLYLARCELALGDLNAALGYAQQAVDLVGENNRSLHSEAHLMLGQIYFMQRRDQECTTELSVAGESLKHLSATRKVAESWHHAAETMSQLGDHDASVDAYQRALSCVGL
ncbi:helix-turn-helix domain-containing protein [Acrocarpospora pleiomorpha]|uniref:helix-turn-helix domain-containing protein n=1 Tax=Acrocarpospora pleiomorpha TaxID=90975 RepID=UPI00280B1D5F|nr:helix-turn-helix domain-containing protein [Acrocarpospora pleiomorpha]